MQPIKWLTCGLRALVIIMSLLRSCDTVIRPTGGESAVKLLTKFGLLEAAVDYATDSL